MAHFRGNRSASGGPGDEPRWTGVAKDRVGTAYSMGGRVWFTIGQGILTEVYYPTIDRLRWTTDNWKASQDSQSHATGIGGENFDVGPGGLQSQLDFTFFWPDRGANGGEWEGQNHRVQAKQ